MIEKEVVVINKLGLHARAAAKLVSLASTFDSNVTVQKDGREVNGKSIMGVMMLAASQNTTITFFVDGTDEADAILGLEALVKNRFGEDK
ncbi:MAG: HPr family phosphocarrier protein [Thiohalomonadales bacterium]